MWIRFVRSKHIHPNHRQEVVDLRWYHVQTHPGHWRQQFRWGKIHLLCTVAHFTWWKNHQVRCLAAANFFDSCESSEASLRVNMNVCHCNETTNNWWHSNSAQFYLNFSWFPGESELTGATNLMAYYGLEHSYTKFSGKKVKEQLSSFLPNLPGVIDGPGEIVSVFSPPIYLLLQCWLLHDIANHLDISVIIFNIYF